MVDVITQQFRDEIAPIRIDATNGDGRIITVVDWASEAASRVPVNATSVQWSFTLEYLSFHYFFPSLNRVPTTQLPIFKLAESDSSKQAKSIEFKRKFGPEGNYAVQFLLWRWFNGSWRPVHSGRDWLTYLGLEGHIGLIYPYFLDEPGVMFGGVRHKIGISIHPRFLEAGDYIEINGGYSGGLSYVPIGGPGLEESIAGSVSVGRTTQMIVPGNPRRAALYVSNGGSTPLYFRFSGASDWLPPAAPFIQPGESLSVEHAAIHYSGGNSQHLSASLHSQISLLPLTACRMEGTGAVSYQELIFL